MFVRLNPGHLTDRLERIVRGRDGRPSRTLTFTRGVPIALTDLELSAVAADIKAGVLEELDEATLYDKAFEDGRAAALAEIKAKQENRE